MAFSSHSQSKTSLLWGIQVACLQNGKPLTLIIGLQLAALGLQADGPDGVLSFVSNSH